ncbi:hypothetical protein DFH27DRAFT_77666 [Peziza echinospora]|nr:hypothetical protein DFH27DRAFT_77666 [Peziza echinospora]
MSNVLPSEEVAEDYKSSLDDLTFNSRIEIANLTVIAKENIPAAQAIARVIEEHIDKAAPARKLPALYLLDSIVKNIGTPYTIFFGRNLYRTFMDAYTLVDQPIRRKLEEMLQTWKQPVPASTSPTPVFPMEITKKIEAALIKARTAAVQLQQKQMKQQQDRMNLTNRAPTQTPPQQQLPHQPPYRAAPQAPPPNQSYQQPPQQNYEYGRNASEGYNRNTHISPQSATPNIYNLPTHPLNLQQTLSSHLPLGGSPTSVETLHSDITSLIETAKKRFAENPWEEETQKRLQALLDLHKIIQTQQLPPAQLAMVKDQLYKLANPSPPPPPAPPAPVSLPLQAANLAALLAGPLNQFSPPPQIQQPVTLAPHMPSLHLPQSTSSMPPLPPINNAASLFASLQSAGLLPGLGGAGGIPLPPPPPPPPQQLQQQYLRNVAPTQRNIRTPPPHQRQQQQNLSNWRSIDVELNSASLKIPRPHLIPLLYEARPNQCSSCARRFTENEQGRAEKASHLDWHFRVHQRMTESLKRGQNRSWYVGEEDWIRSFDELDVTNYPGSNQDGGASGDQSTSNSMQNINDDTGNINGGISGGSNAIGGGSSSMMPGGGGSSASDLASRKRAAREKYIPVPNDPLSTNSACPVCKEKFETSWHADAEEWVWMDAMRVGPKVYHASCYTEAGSKPTPTTTTTAATTTTATINTIGGGGRTKSRGNTPDLNIGDLAAILKSVKRKAEDNSSFSSLDGSGPAGSSGNVNTAGGGSDGGSRVKIKRES